MFGSGIIDWIYQLVLAIVAYVTSWFSSGKVNGTDEEEVDVKPPMANLMPTLIPDLSSSSEMVENLP